MKHILYLSTSVNLMTSNELAAILQTARTNNASNDVTGLLLYSGGTFIQLLEGEDEVVDKIFYNIAQDSRHKNIVKLIDEPASKRSFADWSMGFAMLSAEKAEKLIGYLKVPDKILAINSDNAAVSSLKTFITFNKLLIKG